MDNKGLVFKEVQHFRQWWVWAILVVTLLAMCAVGVSGYLKGGVNEGELMAMGIGAGLLFILMIYFWILRLHTDVNETGIRVKFAPFPMAEKQFDWSAMNKCYIRQYSPIGEYGGWGLKGTSKNRAYNISGNEGLQIVFNDGRKVLIGTQKSEELTAVLYKLGVVKV
jgi:hypothetical protein